MVLIWWCLVLRGAFVHHASEAHDFLLGNLTPRFGRIWVVQDKKIDDRRILPRWSYVYCFPRVRGGGGGVLCFHGVDLVWFGLEERHDTDDGAESIHHGRGKNAVDCGFD